MYKQLYIIAEYLPKLSMELNKEGIENYYKENSEIIKEKLGIEVQEEFTDFAEYLMNYDLVDAKFEYCVYEDGTMENLEYYWNFQIDFKYEDREPIVFGMGILNKAMYNKSVLKIFAPNLEYYN